MPATGPSAPAGADATSPDAAATSTGSGATTSAEVPADDAGHADDASATRRTARALAVCALVAAGLRAPFLWTGISMDEGGYASVAQQWSRGARLYDTAWLDRPQGLLLTYRALLWIDDGGWTIRLGALLAGVALTVLVGLVGWSLAGTRVAVAAAVVYAVVGVAPHLEGFTLNGELLASVPATAAVAAALRWHRSRSTGWLVAAGVLAGVAMTMKPSGVDGIVVGLAVVALGAAGRPGARRRAATGAGVFLAGVAVPVAACALHGWSLGWGRYWTAIAGYQFAAMGGPDTGLGARVGDFTGGLGRVGLDLAVVGVAAAVGLWLLRRSRSAAGTLTAWLAAAVVGVNLGGSYWPHYYVQLLPALAVLAGVAVAAVPRPVLRAAAVVLVVLPQLVWLVALVPATPAERRHAIPYYGRALRDERIAAAIRAETTPRDRVFVLVSETNLYFLAQRTADYPYLWGKPIEKIPDALPRLRAMLVGPDRPALVVLNSAPDDVDRTGAVSRALAAHYRVVRVVDGVPLLRAVG